MLIYDRIRQLCREKGVTVTGTEAELGFARGSLCKIDKNKPSAEKVAKLAEYLDTTTSFILTGVDENGLSEKDARDIAKDLDSIMSKLDSGEDGPLRYNGQEIDDDSRILLRNAIELGLTQLKKENKKLYNPNKNKK